MFKLVCFLFLSLPVPVSYSQSEDLTLKALRQQVVEHRYILRNFSAQASTRYHYQDLHLEQDAPPLVKSAALFEVKDASLQGTLLTLRGQRSVLVEDKVTSQVSVFPQAADASIEVDLGTVDQEKVLRQLIDDLFFPSVTSALAALPPYLKMMVPYRINVQPKPCRDCTHWIRLGGTWQELSASDTGLQNPQLIQGRSGAEPPLTRKDVTHTAATFAFVVDEKGHTAELWLNCPAGYGADEFWASVLSKQAFWPGKYHGVVVATPVAQQFDYQRF